MASSSELPLSSRKIASRACDACRHRKVQCVFEDTSTWSRCRRCNRQDLSCTFLKGHRLRGPRAHRPNEDSVPPLAKVEIDQLCSVETLNQLIHGYQGFVHPLIPLVDQEACDELLASGRYNTDATSLRRCFSLCAITVASTINREAEYCTGQYTTTKSFVNRACDLVLTSRMITQPHWQDDPSFDSAIDSYLLSTALHYVGLTRRAWSLGNEAIVALRDLEVHRLSSNANRIGAGHVEIGKRAFWLLHLAQIQTCFVSPFPLTVPGFPPQSTDWEAMRLQAGPVDFVRLTEMVRALRDIFATEQYTACLTSLMPHISTFGLQPTRRDRHVDTPSFSQRLVVARQISARLEEVVASGFEGQLLDETSEKAGVSSATLRIMGLYFTNSIVDAIFEQSGAYRNEAVRSAMETESDERSPDGLNHKLQLWSIRESICQKLLAVLQSSSTEALELNGFSLIHQIRKIAASVLVYQVDPELSVAVGPKSKFFLTEFSKVLAKLDLNLAVNTVVDK